MYAFILRRATQPYAPLWSVAGRPLLARQLEWFYDLGVDEIVVELGVADADREVERWLRSSPLGIRVRALVCEAPRGDVRALAERAGVRPDIPVIQIFADTVARADLIGSFAAAADGGVTITLARSDSQLPPARLAIARPGEAASLTAQAPGWGTTLGSPADALRLTSALLRAGGNDHGLTVHGVEIAPQVWAGRGAWVDPRAALVGPAFIADGAWVQAGATVGPNCVVGERAVIRGGARAAELIVPGDSILDADGELSQRRDADAPAAHTRIAQRVGYLLAAPFVAAALIAARRGGERRVVAARNQSA